MPNEIKKHFEGERPPLYEGLFHGEGSENDPYRVESVPATITECLKKMRVLLQNLNKQSKWISWNREAKFEIGLSSDMKQLILITTEIIASPNQDPTGTINAFKEELEALNVIGSSVSEDETSHTFINSVFSKLRKIL